jgi:peptidoglycan/LPS O-acetylase OafA/YrhL
LIYGLFEFGQNGVFLFFAISGFILSMPFIKSDFYNLPKPILKNYYIRRLTRLEPPFFIYMVSIFLGLMLINYLTNISLPYKFTLGESLGHFFSGLTYTHFLIYGNWNPINPVTWSLEVEIQFYLLMPFVLNFLLRRIKVVSYSILFLMIYILPIINDLFKQQLVSFHLNKSLITYGGHFLVGVVLAYLYFDFKKYAEKKSYYFDLLFALSVFLTFKEENYGLVVLGIFGLFIGLFKGKIFNKLMVHDFFTIIGGMCYTIYLVHFPLLVFFAKLGKSVFLASSGLYLTFALVFVLGLSSILFLLFERPFMDVNWIKKYFPQKI